MICTCDWSPVNTTTEDSPHIVWVDPHCPKHGVRLWLCAACGQENTDEDVRCTQCHKEYEGEEMEAPGS